MVHPSAQIVPKLTDIVQQQVGHADLLAVVEEGCAAQGEHQRQRNPGQGVVVPPIAVAAVDPRGVMVAQRVAGPGAERQGSQTLTLIGAHPGRRQTVSVSSAES